MTVTLVASVQSAYANECSENPGQRIDPAWSCFCRQTVESVVLGEVIDDDLVHALRVSEVFGDSTIKVGDIVSIGDRGTTGVDGLVALDGEDHTLYLVDGEEVHSVFVEDPSCTFEVSLDALGKALTRDTSLACSETLRALEPQLPEPRFVGASSCPDDGCTTGTPSLVGLLALLLYSVGSRRVRRAF